MKALFAKIRGDSDWAEIACDDAEAELGALKQTMKDHGFRVLGRMAGEVHIVNPHSGLAEVIYQLREAKS